MTEVGMGSSLRRAAWIGTGVFAVAAVAGVLAPGTLGVVASATSLILFAAGCGAFVAAYALGVSRSRTERVELAGLFFLSGSAPPPVARSFRWALAVQTAVALVTASIRPYTAAAFGVLVPVFGLGLMALWAGRHGSFPPRGAEPTRPATGPSPE